MPRCHENALVATIVLASASAAALVAVDHFGAGDAFGRGGRDTEFQWLVRGLGLGCQCDLANGAVLFDPRLRGGEPNLPLASLGYEQCRWHPMTAFPEPPAAPDVGQTGE